jgi:hypothetical protein
MNIATRTAKADLLLFLSPNVEVPPHAVADLAATLEEADNSVAAVCPLLADPSGQPIPQVRSLPQRDALKSGEIPARAATSETASVEYPSLDAVMVRKSFVRGMNFFDERFGHYWADADLAMQVRRASKKVLLNHKVTCLTHPAEDPLAGDSLAQVDRVTGAAAFLGKYGAGAFGFRAGAALSALAHFDFRLLSGILSGTKLDGGQAR